MVEFEKYLVEVQDFRKPTDPYRGIYKIYLQFLFFLNTLESLQHVTGRRLDLQTLLGFWPIMPKNLSDTACIPEMPMGGMELCEVPTIDASPWIWLMFWVHHHHTSTGSLFCFLPFIFPRFLLFLSFRLTKLNFAWIYTWSSLFNLSNLRCKCSFSTSSACTRSLQEIMSLSLNRRLSKCLWVALK